VKLQEMLSPYKAGLGISTNDNIISVKVSDTSEEFLTVDQTGLKITGIQEALDTVGVQTFQAISSLQSELSGLSSTQVEQAVELDQLHADIEAVQSGIVDNLDERLSTMQDAIDSVANDVSDLKAINFDNFITSDEVNNKINDTLAGVQISIDRIDGGRITDVA
jgi:division protein CdvB (Snf7/Vps24/ESCRT-III family)